VGYHWDTTGILTPDTHSVFHWHSGCGLARRLHVRHRRSAHQTNHRKEGKKEKHQERRQVHCRQVPKGPLTGTTQARCEAKHRSHHRHTTGVTRTTANMLLLHHSTVLDV